MTPTRADVLTTLYTLVNDDQLRMYARIYAGFPRERLPGRGASLADLAAVVVDTATPEVWARFVGALAEERPGRDAEIALLRRWVPGSLPSTGARDLHRDLRQWATPGTVEIGGQTFAAKVTLPERPPTTKTTITLDAEATSDGEHVIPVTMTLTYETMRLFALVALDGSGVHGLGADLASARAHALSTRDDGDPAWLDTLRPVTLSGEPAAVQALVDALSSPPAGGDVWEGT